MTDWPELNRYKQANATLEAPQPGRVVFFGDSIVENWPMDRSFPGRPYVNRGIGGQTTAQMLVRFRQDVIKLRPAAVLLLGGTNDIVGFWSPVTQDMIEDNILSMVELAKAHEIRVIVAAVLPAIDYPWKPGRVPAPQILSLNIWLARHCLAQKITFLDCYTAMAAPDGGMKPGLSTDGVHPNHAGYAIMTPLAQAAIDAEFGAA